MGFGIGTNTQPTEAGIFKSRQIPVACECWFDSHGKIVPRLFKYKDASDEIVTVRNITISSIERKNFVGVPSVEYNCEIEVNDSLINVRLYYFMTECRWVLCK